MYSPYINACSSLVGSRRTLMMGSGRARLLRSAPRARASGVWLHLRGGDRRTLNLPVLEACCGTSSTFNLGMEKKTFPSKQRAQIFAKFGLPLEPLVVYI